MRSWSSSLLGHVAHGKRREREGMRGRAYGVERGSAREGSVSGRSFECTLGFFTTRRTLAFFTTELTEIQLRATEYYQDVGDDIAPRRSSRGVRGSLKKL